RGQIVSSSTPTTTAVPNSFDHFSDKSTSTSSLLYLNDSYPSYKQQILNPTYSNRFILDKEDEGKFRSGNFKGICRHHIIEQNWFNANYK
ncbi:10667_t:CDS:2, partial [Entrophospora sp. SA101]